MSDIDTAAADSLKVLDPEQPFREVDIARTAFRALHQFWNWPLATDHIFMADGRFGCEDGVIGRLSGRAENFGCCASG